MQIEFPRRRNVRRSISFLLLTCLLLTSCRGPHVEVTRMMGMFPPNSDEESDFLEDATKRCEDFQKPRSTATQDCIEYWKAVLWAQDYRDYVGARAVWNHHVIYLGGVIVLASAAALVGFAAFGATSSDAYTIIPIAGTFLGGLLAYSKNDALYEAYETAGMKIDQALRDAADKVATSTAPPYQDAASLLRREVGGAIDALTRKKMEIVKFQSQNQAEQFKALRDASSEREVGALKLIDTNTDVGKEKPDPKQIVAVLNSAVDPQKIPPREMRLALIDTAKGTVHALRVSSITGAEVRAEIPPDLMNPGTTNYRIEVQARDGDYTIKDSQTISLKFSTVSFEVKITGSGNVTYPNQNEQNKIVVVKGKPLLLTAVPGSGVNHIMWKSVKGCRDDIPTCTISPDSDTKLEVQFTK